MNYPLQILIGEKKYEVDYNEVLKRTSSVRFRRGKVVINLSRFLKGHRRDVVVEKFLRWAEKKLQKASSGNFIDPVYEDGGRVCTHNKIYEINVFRRRGGVSRAFLRPGNIIELYIEPDLSKNEEKKKVKFLAEKKIIDDQISYLEEVLSELNQLYFQEDYKVVRLKRMHGRFGSCSSKRNINIAYRLLFAPREVFRYVCVHELAHLKEFNHSKKFWALVEGAMPEYKKCEKWLKDSGFVLG